MSIEFRPFQAEGIDQVAKLVGRGVKKILFQAPTGAGKSVLFCGLIQRYLARFPDSRVIIAVHRQELLKQAVETLRRVAGIEAGMVIAGANFPVQMMGEHKIPKTNAKVIVGMVETLHNRFKKYDKYLGGIDLLIVDEVHRGEFTKIYQHFPESIIIGFTATPIAANKKTPLKDFFQEIVSPVSIRQLIDQKILAKPYTVTIKNGPDRSTFRIIAGDFDERSMGEAFSKAKHVKNCLDAYKEHGLGAKTMIFNCNVEHSRVVTAEFVAAGYNCRHMDGTGTDEERKEILDWLRDNDDAILCSVGIYTTGLDEPTIKNIIINRATMSLPLFLQMAGRGSRSIPNLKSTFTIIDLGGNVDYHLPWEYPHDWRNYFLNPAVVKPPKGGAPTKDCPKCEHKVHISVKICPECGYDFTKPEVYDAEKIDLVVLTKDISIEDLIRENENYKPYRVLHVIKAKLVKSFRAQYHHRICSQASREFLNDRYQVMVKDWCKEQKKDYNKWHKDITREWLMEEMNRVFGPAPESYQH